MTFSATASAFASVGASLSMSTAFGSSARLTSNGVRGRSAGHVGRSNPVLRPAGPARCAPGGHSSPRPRSLFGSRGRPTHASGLRGRGARRKAGQVTGWGSHDKSRATNGRLAPIWQHPAGLADACGIGRTARPWTAQPETFAACGLSGLRAGFVLRDESIRRRCTGAPLGSACAAPEHDAGGPALGIPLPPPAILHSTNWARIPEEPGARAATSGRRRSRADGRDPVFAIAHHRRPAAQACRCGRRRRDRHRASAPSSTRNRVIAASTSWPRASISSRSSIGERVSPTALAVGLTAFRS